jgi:hypothetical protein
MPDQELYESLVLSTLNIAHHWRLAGRWADTLTLLYGAVPVANELNDVRRAQVWLHISRTLNDQATFGGQEAAAQHREALTNALRFAEASGDASLLGVAWDSMGMAEHAHFLNSNREKEPEHELEYFERGLKFREAAGDARGLAESYFHLGLVHQVVRGDSKTGEPFFERSYELAKQANDLVIQSYAVRHIGFARDAAGDAEGARQGYAKSLELREQAGFTPGVAMALVTLGEWNAENSNQEQARELYLTARRILDGLGAKKRVEWVNQLIAKLDGG